MRYTVIDLIKDVTLITALLLPMYLYIQIGGGYAPLGDYVGAMFKILCFIMLMAWYLITFCIVSPELRKIVFDVLKD